MWRSSIILSCLSINVCNLVQIDDNAVKYHLKVKLIIPAYMINEYISWYPVVALNLVQCVGGEK